MSNYDYMQAVTSKAMEAFDNEFDPAAVLESQLTDLRSMYDGDVAIESDGGKSMMEKIREGLDRMRQRFVELIRLIVRKVKQMIDAIKSIAVGTVKAPTELANAYKTISDEVYKMSDSTGNYCMNCMEYVRGIQAKLRSVSIAEQLKRWANGKGEYTEADAERDQQREYQKTMENLKASLDKINGADILREKSIEEYIGDLRESEPRTAEVDLRSEQIKLGKVQAKWDKISWKAKEAGEMIAFSIRTMEKQDPDKDLPIKKQAYAQARAAYGTIYNHSIAVVNGMTVLIARCQKYLSCMRQLRKVKPISADSVRDSRPTVGVLPAHA